MPEILDKKILNIESLSPKGRPVAHGQKLHVIGALPGEEVAIADSKRRRKFAHIEEIITASKDRVEPRCSHVPECGGCALQHMDYMAQLKTKQEIVEREFAELGGEMRSIIGCTDPFRYRNKMEFSFSQDKERNRFLGLMMAGGGGKVLNLRECHLVSKWYAKALSRVRLWWEESGLDAYHHYSDRGHLRTLTLREAKQGKGKMAMLTVSGNPDFALSKSHLKSFVECIKKTTDESHLSIFLQVHQICKGKPTQFFEMLLDGPDHITEKLHIKGRALEFKISPTSFFQPNTLQAQKLYHEGLNLLSDLSNARVYDLYCGGATIGLSAALTAKEVLGIELNPHSVFDAGWNKEVNEIENFSIERGDVGDVLSKLEGDPPDVVIVDPPRSGLDAKALDHVKNLKPREVLYISCNPKTQAANIKELLLAGYMLKTVQPVDQFPHTMHIENIAYLIFPGI